MSEHDKFRKDVWEVLEAVRDMLAEKNKSYGNAALEPSRIFSKADSIEQLNVRIDDKLSRIAKGKEFDGDDTELDLIGYLVIRRIARKRAKVPQVNMKPGMQVPETKVFGPIVRDGFVGDVPARPHGVGMTIDDAFARQAEDIHVK